MARRIVLRRDDTPEGSGQLTIDYEGELNPQQAAAATAKGGPVLIVAGAGTGKTRTLVYRVAYLVETGVRPEQITLLTFTRRAAREMLTRASALLDGRCQRVRGGTFHAFCLSILRRHAQAIGFKERFTILDSADAADVVDILRTNSGYHKGEKRFPRKKTLYNMFSAERNRDQPLEEVVETQYPQFIPYMDALHDLATQYDRYKRQHSLMDFDDLLLRTLELFQAHDDIRKQVATRCRHVLVDEYQDTNRLQAELVRHFGSVHGNVTVVGDDAQSIYRFRGADFRNIFAFPEQFDNTQVLKLEENYRSTQAILDLANYLIGQAQRSFDKELVAASGEAGDTPAVVPATDARDEARFVAQMIHDLREGGTPLNDMAVLFRSSFNSYDVEVELNRKNIPFVKYGGMKLSEAAHIKDVLAHLKVLENPADAASWNRVLQLLHGIGPKTAGDLIDWITSDAEDPFTLKERFYSGRYVEALKELFNLLRRLRTKELPLIAQVEAIVDYYEPICKDTYYEDFPKRLQDLEHFVGLAENGGNRSDFLSSLALDPIELTAMEAEPTDEDEPPLILSTIHSAKGLEFSNVFIIHALEGVLPSGYALKDPEAIDEELRLLYVAVTRAEDDLFISYPMLQYRRYQGEHMARPSRFIEEVPEDLLETVRLVEEDAAALPEAPSQEQLPAATGDGAAEEADTPAEPSAPDAPVDPTKEVDDQLPF